MDLCPTCGEPIEPGALCGVCLFSTALDPGPELPDRIGNYRILRLLGEGGMGSVFEAEQDQPRRTVALKVIRASLLTSQVLQRFAIESQALARLHHPGIAQVYEVGTADSGWGTQPYFVMEYIEGLPLDTHAASRKLNTLERLTLMGQVCDAVEHAHRRGVIHRDLKPGNIIVDETGQPKILDFGLARITGSDAQATRQTDMGQLLGTLAYMSPEQVLADPTAVDTRSDVYSLGVILYELLAGKLPYTVNRQLHEAVLAIREQDAAPLSSINHVYRGDIETIVAKALEKDPNRRYQSAADLAADIRRHMEHQPITAKPPSALYQLGKFARRHRAFVIGVAAVFVVLIAGVLASMREASLARAAERAAIAAQQAATRERDRALQLEQQAVQSRNAAIASEAQAQRDRNLAIEEKKRADLEAAIAAAVNAFLQNDLLAQASANKQSARRAAPDPDLKVRTALDRAAERISGKFPNQPEIEAAIRTTLGESYTDLGVYPEARKQLERAIELHRLTSGPDHQKTIQTTHMLSRAALYQGKHGEAESISAKALESSRRALGPRHPATMMVMTGLANAYTIQGKNAQAEALYKEVVQISRLLNGPAGVDTLAMNNLAGVYTAQGKYDMAEALQRETVEIRRRSFGPENPATLESMSVLANVYFMQSKYKDAEAIHTQVLATRRRILGPEHLDTLMSTMNLGATYTNQNKYKESERLYNQLLPLVRRIIGPEHRVTLATMTNLAVVLNSQGKPAQAEPLLVEALELRRRVMGPDHADTLTTMHNLAMTLQALARYPEAEALAQKALELRRRVLGQDHPAVFMTLGVLVALSQERGQFNAAETYAAQALTGRRKAFGPDHTLTRRSAADLAFAQHSQGKLAETEALTRQTLATNKSSQPRDWEDLRLMAILGASLAGLKQFEAAEPLLLDAHRGMDSQSAQASPPDLAFLKFTSSRIADLYRDWGKPSKATEWLNR